MPERRTTTRKSSTNGNHPIVFLHATGTDPADKRWLEAIRKLEGRFFSHAPLEGVEQTRSRFEDLGALIEELTSIDPESPVIFIRAGVCPQKEQLQELVRLLSGPDAAWALTVTSNGAGECNPFAGLPSDHPPGLGNMRDAVALMGRRSIHPWSWWPDHLLALSPRGCARLKGDDADRRDAMTRLAGKLGLAEWLFVPDHRAPAFSATHLEPTETARPKPWGALSRQLLDWLSDGAPTLGLPPGPSRPVTLHITHSWGGGVALWTRSFIENDTSGAHLQLRSESAQTGQGHGQRLALYGGATSEAPLATWWLQPPIQSVDAFNEQYTEILAAICARFPVGRVLVSSLVGHSLDALRTGLPTIQVLHDYFPVWPLLSVHPEAFLKDGQADLEAALIDQAGKMEFNDHDVDGWQSIRENYLAAVKAPEVQLAAPSRSVIDLITTLAPALQAEEIRLIPHGAPELGQAGVIRPRPRTDKKIRLLVPGRIQPGKGKQLLLDSLPELSEVAQVYLLGTGKHGEDFFGLPGVSVVLQYDREELADLLAAIGPQAVALLSVVPETFSYTLSEMQQFGLPVIATRRGSFAERIEHGRNGWLIEPDKAELVAAVRRFAEDPAALIELGQALHAQPVPDMQTMVAAYNDLCPPARPAAGHAHSGLSLAEAQAEASAGLSVISEMTAASERRHRKAAERAADERTRWAEKADRAHRAIQKRNAALEEELEERRAWAERANDEAAAARERIAEIENELEDRTAWAQRLNQDLDRERNRIRSLEAELATTQVQLKSLENNLAHTEEQRANLQDRLSRTRESLHQSRNDLQIAMFRQHEIETQRRKLQELQDQILGSLSWRITRPLRVGRRALRNLWQARIYNPARWPLLLSKLARYLVMQGPGGTLRRLQAPAQSDNAAGSGRDEYRSRAITPPTGEPDVSPDNTAQKELPKNQPPAKSSRPEADPGSETARPDPSWPVESGEPPESEREESPEPEAPLHFDAAENPLVSIVIPAYNQWRYTRQCLESLQRTSCRVSFDVILVDDASSDRTGEAVGQVHGITYLRNEENQGFIRSCNRGAEAARGEFLVLLNNDTEVRDGWLDHLVDTFERVPDAGLVGAKLVYPDGSLQECGGLIFSDGDGWNYGKHDDPDKPEYQYLRETDYCSGACIMLRTATFHELGGFDERYAPAYYEDTDLAFRIRERGLKVLVQPESVVVHHEGITSGTDVSSGAKQYQDINRATFLERWKGQLERQPPHVTDPDDDAQVRHARDSRFRGKVLVIDATTPEPDQDSGSVRLTNILRCFRDLGYKVTFFADNRMHAGRYTRDLQRDGIEVLYLPWHDPVKAFFQQRGGEFDFVFISRHYIAVNYLSLLEQHCPDVPLIFDTVDLHYLREQRLAELEDSKTLRQVARQTRRSELGVVGAADVTVVVSTAEVEVLAQDAPGARVHVLSNIHDVPGCRAAYAERKDLFFVGGYQHPPNIDAACWFVQEVWPLVRARLPDVTFHLIGSKATEEVRALAGNGVVFHGFVEDLEPWLDGCRLAVAPLRYGAGVKGKVNMSMSYGQPVVATPVAVEGMYAQHGREVLVADTAEAFAEEIVRLYSDEALWRSISAASVRNVEQYFSLDAARRSLDALLTSLSGQD